MGIGHMGTLTPPWIDWLTDGQSCLKTLQFHWRAVQVGQG